MILSKEEKVKSNFFDGDGPYVRIGALIIMIASFYLTFKEKDHLEEKNEDKKRQKKLESLNLNPYEDFKKMG